MEVGKILTIKNAGYAALLYAGGSFAALQTGALANLDMKTLALWVVGGLIAALGGDKVQSLFRGNPKLDEILNHLNNGKDKEPAKDVEVDRMPELSAMQIEDTDAVNHLATRFEKSGDQEGLDLCRKLQDRVFTLHHPAKVSDVKKV